MRGKDAFSCYHPAINFIYFTFIIIFTMIYMHPVTLVISLASAFVYSVYLNGAKAIKFNFSVALPMILLTGIINPIFSKRGTTVFAHILGRTVTTESLAFGLVSGVMIVAVILWFSCYNTVMTSDKFIYLFGKIIPSVSLIFSMILKFIPRYKNEVKKIASAQKSIGKGISQGNINDRFKNISRIVAITINWALEDGIVLSSSMKSRGYGLKGRTNYSIYKMGAKDELVLLSLLALATITIITSKTALVVEYFPTMGINKFSGSAICGYLAFLLFCNFPIIINILEDSKWKLLA